MGLSTLEFLTPFPTRTILSGIMKTAQGHRHRAGNSPDSSDCDKNPLGTPLLALLMLIIATPPRVCLSQEDQLGKGPELVCSG